MKHEILNFRKTSIALCLIACFSACSNVENVEQNEGQPVEIKLSSSVTPESRALTPTQSTQIAANEMVYVWAEKSATTTAYINAWALTSDGGGKLSPDDIKYFPTDKSALDIYALHGNFTYTTTDTKPASISSYSVLADQSVVADYCKSDLLYAISPNVAPSANTIALDFKHLLSKIEIKLTAGTEVSLSDVTSVKVLNTLLTADITLETSKATATITPTGTAAEITAYKSSDESGVYAEAIVIPQEVSGTFVQVTVGGDNYYYTIPTTKLVSGYKYVLDLTVGESAATTTRAMSWN